MIVAMSLLALLLLLCLVSLIRAKCKQRSKRLSALVGKKSNAVMSGEETKLQALGASEKTRKRVKRLDTRMKQVNVKIK